MKRSSGFQIDTSWGSRQTQINGLGDQIDQLFFTVEMQKQTCIRNTLHYVDSQEL